MTWPRDFLRRPTSMEKREHLVVFVLSPFSDQFNDISELIADSCYILSQQSNIKIIANRADSSSNPTTIHDDIWKGITQSDVIIADITGHNGNVMIELGITSALRERHEVIIIQEKETEMKFLFDISPERHILYERTYSGFSKLRNDLLAALQYALTPAPYIPSTILESGETPNLIDCRNSDQAKYLLGPINGHKKIRENGLEFGSFVVFLNSWLTFGNGSFDNVHVKLNMRFSEFHPDPSVNHGWIGLSLRSISPYANMGHLVYVQRDSKLMMTVPISEYEKDDDQKLGDVDEVTLDQVYKFDITFDDNGIHGKVNNREIDVHSDQMKYIRNAGQIRIQTYLCRACIESIEVKRL